MKVAVLMTMLAMGADQQPALAQVRVSSGSDPQRPGAAPRPRGGPSRAPRAPLPPFRSTLIVSPARTAPHRMFPLRVPWFGLVLFDSSWWSPIGDGETSPLPAAPPLDDGRPTGGLQIDVDPRRALVYVDGWFVGIVESFSGYYNHLDLAAGPHQIELVAPEYEPLLVDVVVTPGRTTTYRGSLNRAQN